MARQVTAWAPASLIDEHDDDELETFYGLLAKLAYRVIFLELSSKLHNNSLVDEPGQGWRVTARVFADNENIFIWVTDFSPEDDNDDDPRPRKRMTDRLFTVTSLAVYAHGKGWRIEQLDGEPLPQPGWSNELHTTADAERPAPIAPRISDVNSEFSNGVSERASHFSIAKEKENVWMIVFRGNSSTAEFQAAWSETDRGDESAGGFDLHELTVNLAWPIIGKLPTSTPEQSIQDRGDILRLPDVFTPHSIAVRNVKCAPSSETRHVRPIDEMFDASSCEFLHSPRLRYAVAPRSPRNDLEFDCDVNIENSSPHRNALPSAEFLRVAADDEFITLPYIDPRVQASSRRPQPSLESRWPKRRTAEEHHFHGSTGSAMRMDGLPGSNDAGNWWPY